MANCFIENQQSVNKARGENEKRENYKQKTNQQVQTMNKWKNYISLSLRILSTVIFFLRFFMWFSMFVSHIYLFAHWNCDRVTCMEPKEFEHCC